MEEKGWVIYQDKELLPPAVLDKAPGSESSHQLSRAVLHPPVLAPWDNRHDYSTCLSDPSGTDLSLVFSTSSSSPPSRPVSDYYYKCVLYHIQA